MSEEKVNKETPREGGKKKKKKCLFVFSVIEI